MLSWFRKKIEQALSGSQNKPAPPTSAIRVTFDDDAIAVRDRDGAVSEVAWCDLTSVTIVTNDTGPIGDDLFWVLTAGRIGKSVTIPMGAQGEHELLHAMQERLADFDNVTVIEAMGSVENATFTIWKHSAPAQKPRV